MAGRGERFLKEGYETPKPLIEFDGKTMIEYAIESLGISGNYIFIVYRYRSEELNSKISKILEKYSGKIIYVDYITEGPASSALLAKNLIDNEEPLIITNCDQIMNWNSDRFIEYAKRSSHDGIVVTYDSNTPKNSYVSLDQNGNAEIFAEKKVISNLSLNGIHLWKKGSYFVKSAERMIENNIRCNNEFYISLTYNEMIDMGYSIGVFHIKKEEHNAVGTPEDLEKYLINKK